MQVKNRFLSALGLLALLVTGFWMMGNGLGADYAITSQQQSGWLTLLGLILCLGSGYLMTFIATSPKEGVPSKDTFS
jgi:hypothetical protein